MDGGHGEGEKMRNAEGWIDIVNRGQRAIEGKRQEQAAYIVP